MADLITLQEYKNYHTITSDTKDTKISLLISAVSALIEAHCARSFHLDTYTEYHDAKTNYVCLKNFPVTAVTSVKVSEDGGVTQTTLTENATDKGGYLVDLDQGHIYTQIDTYKFLTSYDTPVKSLEVVYMAGYTEIPKDLKLVTMDLVNYYKDDEHKPIMAMGGASVDNPLPYSSNRFPPHIQRVLDIYRVL